jgi:hypothetical protein
VDLNARTRVWRNGTLEQEWGFVAGVVILVAGVVILVATALGRYAIVKKRDWL